MMRYTVKKIKDQSFVLQTNNRGEVESVESACNVAYEELPVRAQRALQLWLKDRLTDEEVYNITVNTLRLERQELARKAKEPRN